MTKAEAREAMRLHARTGISLKEAWKRIRGGRGSRGGGRRTRSAASSGGSTVSGRRSRGPRMPRSGKGRKRHHSHKHVKPRVAVIGGAVVGLLNSEVSKGNGGAGFDIIKSPDHAGAFKQWVKNLATDPAQGAKDIGIPLGIGIVASVLSDKVGVNKALAKARMPFRI